MLAIATACWNFLEARRWRAEHEFRPLNPFEFGRFLKSDIFADLTRDTPDQANPPAISNNRVMLIYLVTANDCGQPLLELVNLLPLLKDQSFPVAVIVFGATPQELNQLSIEFQAEAPSSKKIRFFAQESRSIQNAGLARAPYRFLTGLRPPRLLDEEIVQFQPESIPLLAARLKAKARILNNIAG